MPALHPAHEAYLPEEPSPLGIYWYTAADVERAIARRRRGGRTTDSGTASPASRKGDSEAMTNSEDDDDDDEDSQSPRKRRRIVSPPAEVEAVGYARNLTRPTSAVAGTEGPTTGSPPATMNATWSFRTLDEEETTAEATSTDDESASAGDADGEAQTAMPPTPNLAPVGLDNAPIRIRSARRAAQRREATTPSAATEHANEPVTVPTPARDSAARHQPPDDRSRSVENEFLTSTAA